MDAREIKEKATQLFGKGKFAKAAEAFEEYCKAAGNDMQARLRMGDAWAKAGKKDRAVHAYQRAAEGFAKEGFLPRAIAASKLILELDPAHQGVQKMLADLYARKSGGARPAAVSAKGVSSPAAPIAAARPAPAPASVASAKPPPETGSRGVPQTAPAFANRADAIDIDLEPDDPPARIVVMNMSPPPPPIEVPAWELPPAASIEIEIERGRVDASGAGRSATAALELDIEMEVAPSTIDSSSRSEPRVSTSDAQQELQEQGAAAPIDSSSRWEPVTPVGSTPSRESPGVIESSARSAPASSAPPGLTPRKSAESPSAWPIAGAPKAVSPKPRGPQTELERSLEAFSQFDEPEAPAAVAPPPLAVLSLPSFTELEIEGDSFLQAVEAAAGVPYASSPSITVSTEEAMEAIDDPKLEPGALPKIALFSDLPAAAFIALFESCPLRRAEPGDILIEQGSHGDSFFVICAGSAKVFRTDGDTRRELATLEEGAFFGEMALLSDSPRTASVEASTEDTQLLEIPAAVLTELSREHPTIATALKKFCRQRLLANLMNGATLFRPFTKSQRRELVQKFRARDVGRGETLIREGQRTDGLYVILTGEVGVRVQGTAVATLKEGDVFGEMSLLTRTPATATVETTKRTSLLRLPREDFDAIIMSHPQILELVAELTDARTRKNAELLKSKATAQSVV